MINILIVDDEPLARQRLIHLLKSLDSCQVIGEAVNGHDALDKTQQFSLLEQRFGKKRIFSVIIFQIA